MDRFKITFMAVAIAILLGLPLIARSGKEQIVSAPVHMQENAPRFEPPANDPTPPSSGVIEQSFRNRASGVPVADAGVVVRILLDDNTDSRHQRFIVRLSSGHTILIAHNMDIAPRIDNLRDGDQVHFSGVYEWNDKGGVVHWTHHDPSARHPAGCLQHNGNLYQ